MNIDFNKKILIIGTNVIETKEHIYMLSQKIKNIVEKNIDNNTYQFIFKVSFDKANRTSISSYRGINIREAIKIFKQIRKELEIPIITDVHEPDQIELLKDCVDMLQIPAFLCRQTDLVKSVAKSNLPIHVKKGQFMNSHTMLKVLEKIRYYGNKQTVILCDRGTMFGYNDLIVDTRNLIDMKTDDNLVSLDITHCLQQPGLLNIDNSVSSGGIRKYVPLMAKIGISSNVNCLFMEVHDNPYNALCDGPTQIPLNKFEELLKYIINYWDMNELFCKENTIYIE